MSEQNEFGPGWALPSLGVATKGKAHYYTAGFSGQSLCGKYTLLGGIREDDNHASPDNCAACARKYFALHPEMELPRRWRRVRVEVVGPVMDEVHQYVYLNGGERGYVHGMTAEQLQADASRGAAVLFERARPRRCVSVKASNLRPLP